MAKWVKNNTASTKTYEGQDIAAGAYYEIQPLEETTWANNSSLITDIGNSDAVMAKDDSGSADITDVAEGLNHLRDENPVKIDSLTPVHTFALAEGDSLRARLIGIHNGSVLTKTQTSTLDWLIPQTTYGSPAVNKQAYMDGIQYRAKDAVEGDKMTFQVVDKDGVGVTLGWYSQAIFDAMGNLYVADEFGKDWPVVPNEKDVIRLYKARLIPGLYIRILFTSTGVMDDITLSVGLFRHMDTSVDL